MPTGPAPSNLRRRLGYLALLTLACAAPFLLGSFRVYQLTLAGTYALAILGLNILTGFSGQISLGHGAFYALGGYVTAGMMFHWGVDAYLTLPAAGLVCFAAGLLVGWPAARLPFLGLALATYALAVALPQFLKSYLAAPWTRGVQGIYVDKPAVPAALPLSPDQWWYFVTLGLLVAALWSAANLMRGRVGRAWVALRDDEIAAACNGIDVARFRVLAMATGAAYAGLGGALAVLVTDYIAPDRYGFFFSVQLLIGAVLGGVTSVSGAVVGGLVLQFLPVLADEISKNLAWPVYGALLIASVWLAPEGVVGLYNRMQQVRGRRAPVYEFPRYNSKSCDMKPSPNIEEVVISELKTLVPGRPVIRREDRLIEDLRLLSDDASALTIYVEERLSVKVPLHEWRSAYTVDDVIRIFEKYAGPMSRDG